MIFNKVKQKIKDARAQNYKDSLYNRRNKETAAFVEKKHLAPLTKEEIEEIDAYWKQYGVKFNDYSFFQMQYAVTGIHDPRFIPYNFAYYVLYPYYNDLKKAPIWADKNQFSRILPRCPFPEEIGYRLRGRYCDHLRNCYGETITDEYISALYRRIQEIGCEAVIIKKTTKTSRGTGVRKFRITAEEDVRSALADCNDKGDFIIQKAVEQHPFFSQFNPDSTNILRVTTWRHGNDVEVFAPCLRFGIPGSATDVAFVDGEEIVQCARIDEHGNVADTGISLNGEPIPLDISSKKVPMWDEIIQMVKNNHRFLDYFDIVAWDITVDSSNSIVCFEYNIRRPGIIIYQFAHGPFAGEHTDELLSFLRDPKNRKEYLPRCIRG